MYKTITMIMTAVLLVACQGGHCPARRMTIDATRSDYPIEDLQAAADAWNDAMGFELADVRHAGGIVVLRSHQIDIPGCEGAAGCETHSWLERTIRSCDIWIRGVNHDVLVHELGHCFGLAHDEDPDSIMWTGTKILPEHVEEIESCF